jgi:hypothetical protein
LSGGACQQCCKQTHPEGIAALATDIQACACANDGPCAATCAQEICANGMVASPGDPCNACIDDALAGTDGGAGVCAVPVESACQSDPGCADYYACTEGCP